MKKTYFQNLNGLFLRIECKDHAGQALSFDKATQRVIQGIRRLKRQGNKVFLIGNGGSASIASHVSVDLLKNANVPSLVLNDASLLTCLSNDLGFEFVFETPIRLLSEAGDILFSISSSGRSKNILKATQKARQRGLWVVTFSGFSQNNPLRKLGDINFYVPSPSYGFVEI
ncbi:MAG: SIS domain-containing protein, partial [Candidatus Omnitrophota bacterium]